MNGYRAALLTWAALLLLLGASAASIALLPAPIGQAVSIFFAAGIVAILFATFLGLRSADGLLWIFALGGFMWLGFLFFIPLADFLTR